MRNLCGAGASVFGCYTRLGKNVGNISDAVLASEYRTTDNQRGWAFYLKAGTPSNQMTVLLGKSDGTALGTFKSNPGLTFNAGDVVSFTFENDGVNGLIRFFVNGTDVGTQSVSQNVIYSKGALLLLGAYNNGSVGKHNIEYMDTVVSVNGVAVFNAPLERNTYDLVSKTAGTITGTVDLESTYENADGVYSYNLNNGFDRYTDNATGLITRDVPYIDGVPVVSSVAGYTKQSSHPKGQNNMAWGFVSIAELDRSDVDVFNADCRASVFYDSSNPTFWHLSELNLDTIVSYLEDDYKNTVFVADTLNKYDTPYFKTGDQYDYSATGEPLTKSQNFLIYGTEQTEPTLKKIVKWIDTIGRKGL